MRSEAVLTPELLGIVDHSLNFLLRQTTLVIGNCNTIRFAGRLVRSRDVQDTIDIDIECYFYLMYTVRSWGNAREFEFAEKIVVLRPCTFALVDLDKNTRLVVGR